MASSRQPGLNARALSRLQLPGQPFIPPTECEQLFQNTAITMLSNSVVKQLQGSEHIHLLLGESGLGKSCFCRRLFCDTPPQLTLKFFAASRKSRIDDVLHALNGNGQKRGVEDLATVAARGVFRELRAGQQPALIIDDAHLLRPAVLRMIFRFLQAIKRQGLGTLKLVMVAEKTLKENLNELGEAGPDDEQLQASLLRPLSRAEIADYIEFRISSAGGNNQPLGVKLLNRIHELSGGLPGRVDQLACEAFNHGRVSAISTRPPARRRLAWAATATFIVVAGAACLWFITQQPAGNTTVGDMPSHSAATPGGQAMTVAKNPAGSTAPSSAADAADAAPGEPAVSVADLPADIDTVDVPPDVTDAGNVSGDTGTSPSASTGDTGQSVVGSDDNTLHDNAWLQQWPRNYYVVQLTGSGDQAAQLALANTLLPQLQHALILFAGRRYGDPWFTLLYGVFTDAASAQAAIDQLPASLRANKPWPRRLGDVLNP